MPRIGSGQPRADHAVAPADHEGRRSLRFTGSQPASGIARERSNMNGASNGMADARWLRPVLLG
jgi:hypothetical protein